MGEFVEIFKATFEGSLDVLVWLFKLIIVLVAAVMPFAVAFFAVAGITELVHWLSGRNDPPKDTPND